MPDTSTPAAIRLNWLRETAPGHLETDLGLPVEREALPLALMALHPLQHCQEPDANRILAQIEAGLQSIECFEDLPQWMRMRLKNFFGPLFSQRQLDAARENFRLTRQVCDFIERKADQVKGDVELHVPYFGRKAWLRRFDCLSGLSFEFSADGRLVDRFAAACPIQHGIGQIATALVPAFQKTAGDSFTVALEHCRHTTAENARIALDQMLVDYGLTGALDGHTGELEVRLIVSVPHAACNAWIDTPFGRDANFIPVYSRFSAGIQQALRRWLGWIVFGDAPQYAQLNIVYALLAYQVTRPYIADTRSAFAYDVMEHEKMAALCRAAARRLPRKLALVEEYLRAAGHTQAAGMYAPERAAGIGAWLKNDAKVFPSLLASEGGIVDQSLELAQRFNLCVHAHQFSRAVEHFVTSIDRKLRAMLRRCGVFDPISPVLLAEIIAAMSLARGGPGPELELQLSSDSKTSVHRKTLTRCDSLSSM
ncbi:MAG TPA: hypothetical protein VKV15_25310 [Bryobacteraceae bacterium]|nr:hypothetical protein [Bryobacteraceae bacterium]